MMRVPGSNVLKMAFRAIAKTPLLYYQAIGRTLNSVGQYVTQYGPSSIIYGSFQAIPKSKYEYRGLDLAREYYDLYISKSLIDLQRDISADQIGFQGQRYQLISNTEWLNIDGWISVLCVLIGADADAPSVFGFNAGKYPNLENTNTNFSD